MQPCTDQLPYEAFQKQTFPSKTHGVYQFCCTCLGTPGLILQATTSLKRVQLSTSPEKSMAVYYSAVTKSSVF